MEQLQLAKHIQKGETLQKRLDKSEVLFAARGNNKRFDLAVTVTQWAPSR